MDPRLPNPSTITLLNGIHIDVIHARSFGEPDEASLVVFSEGHHARSQFAREAGET